MKKLELEHLAPYLPYGLKYIDDDVDKIVELHNLDTGIGLVNFGWGDAKNLYEIKPILRPLSDLTKLGCHFIYDQETDFESILDWIKLDSESRFTAKFSYQFWSLLFENHFDLFDLISNNLAIDINTLQP